MLIDFRRFVVVFVLLLTMAFNLILPTTARSQGFAHKHPTATAIAAGAGTTYLLKKSAKYKREHGEKLGLAERHPYLSGFGVAVVTHHMLKKHKQE